MITAAISPRALRVQGHAGFAPAGQDVVCAAVSALVGTLAAYLGQLEAQGQVRALDTALSPGLAEITFRGGSREAAAGLQMAATGLRQLAAQYPACVRVTEGD